MTTPFYFYTQLVEKWLAIAAGQSCVTRQTLLYRAYQPFLLRGLHVNRQRLPFFLLLKQRPFNMFVKQRVFAQPPLQHARDFSAPGRIA